MCVSTPAEVISVHGDTASVLCNGRPMVVDVRLVAPVAAGEYVLVHAGLALERISADEALELKALIVAMTEQTKESETNDVSYR